MMANRFIWCGIVQGTGRRITFRTDYRIDAYGMPVRVHGETLGDIIGPFRTMRAARLMACPGAMVQSVADAERAARPGALS